MSQKIRKNKHASDNSQAQIEPTDRFDFLAAVAMDHEISARNSLSARVATVALRHRHNKSGLIVLKHKTIAHEIGCSVSAVRDAADVLKKRWFKVSPVYDGNECVANRYDPRWDEAAAEGGLWSVQTKRKLRDDEAAETQKDNPVILDDTPVHQDDTHCPSEDGPLPRGDQASALQGTDLCPSEGMRNSVFASQGVQPSVSNPESFHTRSDKRVETVSGSREDRPSGAPADVLDLSAWVDELEKNLPPFEPFGDFKPVGQERSRRGAIQQLKKLRRLDWSLDDIRQYLDAYRRDFDRQAKTNFKKRGQCGKTLASLLTQLVDQCYPETRNTDDGEIYGWNIPERFLRKTEAAAAEANDNAQAADRSSQQADDDPAPATELNSDAKRDRANRGTQACGDWPKPARACIRLQMVYPSYPVRNMHDEGKLIQAELKKLLGKVPYSEVEAGALRYAEAQKGQDYRKNLKLSAFLAQGRWRDQQDQSRSRAA